MAALEEFESLLKDVVQAKRLSASKMGKLTEIAQKTMSEDTQLVSILYRTHKSLPAASKVSSLYVFDALARAARSHCKKHPSSSGPGTAASFLLKLEGILDGLFQDMVSTATQEAKEKSQKILDIWAKGSTFPAATLTHLGGILKGEVKGAYHNPMSFAQYLFDTTMLVTDVKPTSTSDPRAGARQDKLATPPLVPSPQHQPPTSQVPPVVVDPQTTLLALLSAAVATSSNAGQAPGATQDAQGLALLQHLRQAATLGQDATQTPHAFTPPPPPLAQSPHTLAQVNSARSPPYTGQPQATRDPRTWRNQSPDATNHEDGRQSRPRGSFRGNFIGRGPDREDPRFSDRDTLRRTRNSRSRSPPSRVGARRDVKPYSPPRRPSSHVPEYAGHNAPKLDEFGRELRAQSPDEPETPRIPNGQNVPPPEAAIQPVKHDTSPLTSSSMPAHVQPALSTSIAQTDTTEPGMDRFNIATFDFTSPAAWESLGKMWQVTNGVPPSTTDLQQFIQMQMAFMVGAVGLQPPSQDEGSWDWNGQQQTAPASSRGRGRGRGGFAGRGRYQQGSSGGNDGYSQWDSTYVNESEAVVLSYGEDEVPNRAANPMHEAPSINNSGGSMQKVGDTWQFVRNPVVA